ncbi:unnamed protein product, partial [Phaeothamnion confervicola]
GRQEPSASKLRDVQWTTWTCPLGWPVQGIWSAGADGTDINAVDRSHTFEKVPVLATADDFGRVKLFPYPALGSAADKCYRGHSSHVTCVRFSHDDGYLVTTGGADRCVFVWRTDCVEEAGEVGAAAAAARAAAAAASLTGGGGNGDDDDDGGEPNARAPFADGGGGKMGRPPSGGGDEFMAVKPWRGAIREPTTWKEPAGAAAAAAVAAAPAKELALAWVHGYQGQEARNNVWHGGGAGEVIYHAAAVGVVLDTSGGNGGGHRQLHNLAHDDDIVSLAVHPRGDIVATGALGKKPKIALWDTKSGTTLRVIEGYHRNGVALLAFSAGGTLLASVGMDDDHCVAVHRIADGALVAGGKGDRGAVLCLATSACDDGEFVTGGSKNVRFWTLAAGRAELQSKRGVWGAAAGENNRAVSAAFLGGDAVTGQADGTLALWKGRAIAMMRSAHQGAVTCLRVPCAGGCGEGNPVSSANRSGGGLSGGGGGFNGDGVALVSGGKDGCVLLWDGTLVQTHAFDLTKAPPPDRPARTGVSSVALRGASLLVGTAGSEIYEVDAGSGRPRRLTAGHCCGELWGLAAHPALPFAATAGDDGEVIVWDCAARAAAHRGTVAGRARAAAYSLPDGGHLAVGMQDGSVVVLTEDLSTTATTVAATAAGAAIQALAYAPDGRTLAAAAADRCLYLLEVGAGYGRRAVCRGHNARVTHLDWSADSKHLQSNCAAGELLFWDARDGKQ